MQNFDQRLRRIDRRHQKLSRGMVMSVNKDGLIVAQPSRSRFAFPWRGLLMALVAVMVVKGLVHAQIGATDYEARIVVLSQGSTFDQVGAWFMQADPVTLWLSAQFAGTAL
jgi:hypothetical protein